MKSDRKKKVMRILALGLISLVIIGILSGAYFYFTSEEKDSFSLNRVFLKTIIKEGESLSTNFKVTSNVEGNDFSVRLNGLDKFTNVSETEFSLNRGESKEIIVSFEGVENNLGIFVGSVLIKDKTKTKILPVILEIQSHDTFFSSKIDASSRYRELSKGEDLVTELTIFNLRDNQEHDISIRYNIYNSEGKSIYSDFKNATVGTKSTITNSVIIPASAKEGKHFLTAVVELNGFVSTASYLFDINEKSFEFLVLDTRIISSITGLLLIVILLILIYIIYERNKLFRELKGQQSSQIKFYSSRIDKEKKNSLSKAKNKKEKEKIKREYEKAKKEIIRRIKDQQKGQKKKLRKLRDKKDKKYIRKKLQEWKGDVYSKALEKAEINGKLKRKLSALEKAYSEGYISGESYKKGKSRIKSAKRS